MQKILFILAAALFFPGTLSGEDSISADNPEVSSQNQVYAVREVKQFPFLDISLIGDMSMVYRNIETHEMGHLSRPGFGHAEYDHGHGHSHGVVHENTGFNLNYAELVLSSAVDPFLDMFSTFHLSQEGFEIEELYVDTKMIPGGIQLRAGRFLSAFGRLNSLHAHNRDFADQPVIYEAVFGGHGLLENGVRAAVTLPLPFYLTTGIEILQGDNSESFGREGFESGDFEVEDGELPELFTGYINVSTDIGKNFTILGGVSGAVGKTRFNHGIEETSGDQEKGAHGVEANTWIAGADITAKYYFDSYRYLSFQSEGIYRQLKGDRYGYSNDESPVYSKQTIIKKQGGFYCQTVLKPFMEWRFGARFELIPVNKVIVAGNDRRLPENFSKRSLLVDYLPSELTFIRLQYNFDRSKYHDGHREPFHEVIVQMNFAVGKHGAHNF